jgi:hypothetical protein
MLLKTIVITLTILVVALPKATFAMQLSRTHELSATNKLNVVEQNDVVKSRFYFFINKTDNPSSCYPRDIY